MLYKVAGICVSSLEGLFCCQLNLLITKFNFKIILFHFLNLNTYTECVILELEELALYQPISQIFFFNVIIVLWWLEIFSRFNKLNSFLFSGSSNWQTYQCSAETGETLSKGICILPSVFHYFSGLLGGVMRTAILISLREKALY